MQPARSRRQKRTDDPVGRWPFFLALAATPIIRLAFVLEMRNQPYSAISQYVVDSFYYHRWALDILAGNFWGSDVFFLRPLYPYLLAASYRMFGAHILPIQMLQVGMATVSCALLYDCTRRMFDRRAAGFASIGFALSGTLVFYSGALLYVELTVLLSLLFVWLVLVAGERFMLWLSAGIVFGLLVISRPEMLLLLPLFVIWLIRQRVGWRRTGFMLATVMVVSTLVPLRNYVIARDPVLFTAHSGINFYYGNNPAADGTWQPTSELEKGAGFSHERLKNVSRTIDGKVLPWSQASSYWMKKSLQFIITKPGRYLSLLGRKLLLFVANYEVPNDYYPEVANASSIALRLSFVSFGLALALGVTGMIWAWPNRRRTLPAYLLVAGHAVSALAFYVLSRLRAPVIPFLLMFAGYALNEFISALRERKGGRAASGAAISAVVLVASLAIPVGRARYTAQGWTQAGNILAEQHRPGRAVSAFRRALTAQPANAAARYSLLMTLAAMGKSDEAESELQQLRAGGDDSKAGRLFMTLGTARVAIIRRDFPAAAALYRDALALDSTDAETPYLLGLVYVSMDSLRPAKHWLERALVLDPNHDGARSVLPQVIARLSGER